MLLLVQVFRYTSVIGKRKTAGRGRRIGKEQEMQNYRFDSDAGEMQILQDNGFWYLVVEGSRIGTYRDAAAAADDVAAHNTGYLPWDDLDDAAAPASLDQWGMED